MKYNKQKFIETLSAIRWQPAPDGFKCPSCNKETLERSFHIMGGPWSGTIRCTSCNHAESVANYVGKSMVSVRPLTSEEISKHKSEKEE